MNAKKARALRKQAGFEPHKERWYMHMKRHGRTIKSTHVATGARRRYLDLKRAYKTS